MAVPYVRVVTAPEGEAVSRELAKEWCRIDADDVSQDAVIDLLIQGARERGEFLTGRAFTERTLELRLDAFPENGGVIELPGAPLQTVNAIRYVDGDGTLQTISSSPSAWIEDAGSEPGRIQPLNGADWPATQAVLAAARIEYVCGYAPAGSPLDYGANLPALIKQWMNARICTFYERREHIDLANLKALPRDYVDGLLDSFKVDLQFA